MHCDLFSFGNFSILLNFMINMLLCEYLFSLFWFFSIGYIPRKKIIRLKGVFLMHLIYIFKFFLKSFAILYSK